VEIFLLLDLRTYFLPPTSQLFFFSSPVILAITFQFSAVPHSRQTSPLSPPLLRSRVQQSAIGQILPRHDFLPIWQPQTFVDAVALHFASFYSPSLKSLFHFLSSSLANTSQPFVASPFHFTFISAIKPFGIPSFPLPFTHSSSSGWPSLPIDVQAMLLRNRLSFL